MRHFVHKGEVACYVKKIEEWITRPISDIDLKPVKPEGPYVYAAMESDCNECRAAMLVQPVEYSKIKFEGDVSVPTNITKAPDYEPEPYSDADEDIAEKRANVDGTNV